MAVIQFTESDKLAGKLMEKGGQTVQITEIQGPTASKSQKSVNFFTTLKVVKGPFMNKEIQVCFNTETKNVSLLGSMQFFPHRDLLKIKAAIEGVKFDEVGLNLDTDALLNKPFDVIFGVEPNADGGELVNTVTGFFPEGKASGSSTPF